MIRKIGLKKRSLGQGMTEYIIITALIAVAAIGVYSLFGQTIRNQVAGMAQEMSGTSASNEISAASANADAATALGNEAVSLGNYNATATEGTGAQ